MKFQQILNLKNREAPRADNIVNEMITYGGKNIEKQITNK